MEAVVRHSQSYNILFSAYIFTCKCSLLCVIFLVWGLWHLPHYGYWALNGTPLRYPIVAFCYVDPIALHGQYQPLHVFQQFTDGMDVEVG